MAFLIGQMWIALLLVAVIAAAMGWMWHALRSSARLRDLEHERETLRRELVEFVEPEDRGDAAEEYARAIEVMRTRESVAEARWAELERQLTEVKEQRDSHAGRVAELERVLESASNRIAAPVQPRAEDLERIAALEAERTRLEEQLTAPRQESAPTDGLAWRARYFESRTRYLEGEARSSAPTASINALTSMEEERDAARTDAAAWRARAEAVPAESEEAIALKWRARYLEARNRYLERSAREDAPTVDEEAERRTKWRLRYLETRAAHLEAQQRAAPPAEDTDSQRLRWRARYLDARVQHLEGRLASPSAEVAQPEPVAELPLPIETPPLVPHGAEVRPVALPAPRQGAPDDLTLIVGVGPKTEVTLHALGVYHFDQIAEWSRANIAWVDQYLRFRGRIVRERWVEQAQELARGAGPVSHRRRYLETEPA